MIGKYKNKFIFGDIAENYEPGARDKCLQVNQGGDPGGEKLTPIWKGGISYDRHYGVGFINNHGVITCETSNYRAKMSISNSFIKLKEYDQLNSDDWMGHYNQLEFVNPYGLDFKYFIKGNDTYLFLMGDKVVTAAVKLEGVKLDSKEFERKNEHQFFGNSKYAINSNDKLPVEYNGTDKDQIVAKINNFIEKGGIVPEVTRIQKEMEGKWKVQKEIEDIKIAQEKIEGEKKEQEIKAIKDNGGIFLIHNKSEANESIWRRSENFNTSYGAFKADRWVYTDYTVTNSFVEILDFNMRIDRNKKAIRDRIKFKNSSITSFNYFSDGGDIYIFQKHNNNLISGVKLKGREVESWSFKECKGGYMVEENDPLPPAYYKSYDDREAIVKEINDRIKNGGVIYPKGKKIPEIKNDTAEKNSGDTNEIKGDLVGQAKILAETFLTFSKNGFTKKELETLKTLDEQLEEASIQLVKDRAGNITGAVVTDSHGKYTKLQTKLER